MILRRRVDPLADGVRIKLPNRSASLLVKGWLHNKPIPLFPGMGVFGMLLLTGVSPWFGLGEKLLVRSGVNLGVFIASSLSNEELTSTWFKFLIASWDVTLLFVVDTSKVPLFRSRVEASDVLVVVDASTCCTVSLAPWPPFRISSFGTLPITCNILCDILALMLATELEWNALEHLLAESLHFYPIHCLISIDSVKAAFSSCWSGCVSLKAASWCTCCWDHGLVTTVVLSNIQCITCSYDQLQIQNLAIKLWEQQLQNNEVWICNFVNYFAPHLVKLT